MFFQCLLSSTLEIYRVYVYVTKRVEHFFLCLLSPLIHENALPHGHFKSRSLCVPLVCALRESTDLNILSHCLQVKSTSSASFGFPQMVACRLSQFCMQSPCCTRGMKMASRSSDCSYVRHSFLSHRTFFHKLNTCTLLVLHVPTSDVYKRYLCCWKIWNICHTLIFSSRWMLHSCCRKSYIWENSLPHNKQQNFLFLCTQLICRVRFPLDFVVYLHKLQVNDFLFLDKGLFDSRSLLDHCLS